MTAAGLGDWERRLELGDERIVFRRCNTAAAPRVTIGMPTFRRAHTIRRALASVARQSYRDFILIVSDNAGEDQETIGAIAEIAGDLPEVVVVAQDQNLGAIGNLQFLLAVAETDYFMWLADDDEISDDYLSELVRLLDGDSNAVSAMGRWLSAHGGAVPQPRRQVRSARRRRAARIVKYIGLQVEDSLFYGLHRTAFLRRCGFSGYAFPNAGVLTNFCYVFLFDLVWQGHVAYSDTAAWTSHSEAEKAYVVAKAGGVRNKLKTMARRMNVHALYNAKVARRSPLLLALTLPASVAGIVHDVATALGRVARAPAGPDTIVSDRPLRIAHLTVYRDLPSGVRKQITSEVRGARRLLDVVWTSLAVHNGRLVEPFGSRIPAPFRAMFLRSLYGWIVARRLARENDVVLVRHMVFDPFALVMARAVPNRISVHHSMEIAELPLIRPGLSGRLAALMERFAGRFALRSGMGVLGVTGEIARYECAVRGVSKPAGVYPNGIDLDLVPLLADRRSPDEVSIVFMSDTFSLWHGLDRLIDAVRDAADLTSGLHIDLIGKLSDAHRAAIAALGARAGVFRVHGFLDQAAFTEVLAGADIGLGSLALDRQNMHEGSTLKVREMLAMGLPVYCNHADASLPEDFPYFCRSSPTDLAAMVAFARAMKPVARAEVRHAAAPLVDKATAMRSVVDWLRSTFEALPR